MFVWEETSGRPRTCWRDYITRLAWKHLGIPPEELVKLLRGKSGLPSGKSCCLRDQDPDKQKKTNEQTNILKYMYCK